MTARNRIDLTAGAPRLAPRLPAGDLDQQIMAAEVAVIERDRRIQRRAGEVARRLTDHWPVTLGLTLLASFFLGRALAPRRHVHVAMPPSRAALAAEAPLWRILPLLWPLMPERIRGRLPSGTVAILTNIAATLTQGLKPAPKR